MILARHRGQRRKGRNDPVRASDVERASWEQKIALGIDVVKDYRFGLHDR
jgi:hypothetical protein